MTLSTECISKLERGRGGLAIDKNHDVFQLRTITEGCLFCSNGAALFFMIVVVVVDNQVSFAVVENFEGMNERINK